MTASPASARRPLLRRQGRRRPARLARHHQDRDPAGRRAAAPAREPDHADGARPMPLPRFWYLPRDEKAAVVMTGDDHCREAPAVPRALRPLHALSPPGCSVAQLGVRALDLVRLSDSAADERAGGAYIVAGLRGRRCTRVSARCRRALAAGELDRALRRAAQRVRARSTRASRRRSRAARTASTGPTGRRSAKVELAHGIRLDTNYYHYPAAGSAPSRLHERRRLPDALRRPRRHAIDVYQATRT